MATGTARAGRTGVSPLATGRKASDNDTLV